jgi:hypothetical protein
MLEAEPESVFLNSPEARKILTRLHFSQAEASMAASALASSSYDSSRWSCDNPGERHERGASAFISANERSRGLIDPLGAPPKSQSSAEGCVQYISSISFLN